jgi:hypothetical protein
VAHDSGTHFRVYESTTKGGKDRVVNALRPASQFAGFRPLRTLNLCDGTCE